MLRPERERLTEVCLQRGGALAGDAVDEIERDVVKSGITEMVEGTADGVRTGNAIEYLEQLGLEALRAERDAVDPCAAQEPRERRRHRLRVRLDGDLLCPRQGLEQPSQRVRLRERRRPTAEEDRLHLRREQVALELELGHQRVNVRRVLSLPAHDGDEVAVA